MTNHFINILLYLQIPSDVSQIFSDDACSNISESVSMKFSYIISPLFIPKFFNESQNVSIVDGCFKFPHQNNLMFRFSGICQQLQRQSLIDWSGIFSEGKIYVLNLELKSVFHSLYYIIFLFFRAVPSGF